MRDLIASPLYYGSLPLEVILVVIVIDKILIMVLDCCAVASVLGEHGHECEDINALEVDIVASAKFEFMMETESDSFYFEIGVDEHELFILAIAFEHGDVFYISSDLNVSLIEFEAGVKIPSFCHWVDLLDLIERFIIAAAFLCPGEEHGMVEDSYGWRHELIE